jgi:hypothetical protein
MPTRGFDLLLAALDAAVDRSKVVLAVLDVVLAVSAGFVVVLLANLVGDRRLALALALIWAIAVWLIHALVTGAISRIAYVELRGGPRISLAEGVAYATRHAASFVVVPLLPVLAAIAVAGVEWLAFLVSRVPGAGDVLTAVLFLPAVLINAAVLVLVAIGVWLAPAEVAAEGGSPLVTLVSLRRMVVATPGRLLLYFTITLALGAVIGTLLGGLLWVATSQTLTIAASAGSASARAGNIVAMVAALGLDGLAAGRTSSPTAMVPLLIYLLYTTLLVAVVATLPLLVFPLCAACAARLNVLGTTSAPGAVDRRDGVD